MRQYHLKNNLSKVIDSVFSIKQVLFYVFKYDFGWFRIMQNQLSSQKSSLREYIEKIQFMEEEMKKTEQLFATTQQKLEKTTQHLHWVKQERDETKVLVSKHVETEQQLYSQATELLGTVEETITQKNILHSSLDRNKNLQVVNLQSSQKFKEIAHNKLANINEAIVNRRDASHVFHKNIASELSKFFYHHLQCI